MRTKSLLAAAALIAAGALSSQAQNVYSLNVVGYVNLSLQPGYNLITAQLKSPSGSTAINELLTNAPALSDNSTFFKWNEGLQTFSEPAVWVGTPPDGPAWYLSDSSGLSPDTATRGKSYFVWNSGAATTLTLVGEVPQGSDATTIPNNYSFVADFVPTSQQIATNGFPVADNATISTWNAALQTYTEPLVGVALPPDGPAWYLSDFSAQVPFAPAVGQGFVHFTSSGSAPWTRNFTVQ